MNAKTFLIVGGLLLVVAAALGFTGVIGQTPGQSIFGANWWFDNGENWTYLVLGIIGFLSAFVLPHQTRRHLVMLFGLLSVLAGLYSIFIGQNFLGSNLENPADSVWNIVLGAWALWACGHKHNLPKPPADPATRIF